MQIISKIDYLKPPGISLTGVSLSGSKLIISGNMVDIFSLRSLVTVVKKQDNLKNYYFTQINVPSSRSPLYTFTLTMEIGSK